MPGKDDVKNDGMNGASGSDADNQPAEPKDDQNAGAASPADPGGSGSDDDDSSPSEDNQPAGKTFSQDDVTRMMTREKQQGRNAVFNELGIDPNDTKTIEMVKAIMAAQKQDEEPPVAPSADLIEAQHRADVAEAKAEAMMLGAQSKFVDDIVTLATAKLQDSDETDFKTVVSQIKEKYPVWFGEGGSDDDSKNSVGSRGTGSSIGSNAGAKKDAGTGELSLGQRLAASKKSSKPSKSFWSK
jgi:hypothetical protein